MKKRGKLKKSSPKCKRMRAAIGNARTQRKRGKALGRYVKRCGR